MTCARVTDRVDSCNLHARSVVQSNEGRDATNVDGPLPASGGPTT